MRQSQVDGAMDAAQPDTHTAQEIEMPDEQGAAEVQQDDGRDLIPGNAPEESGASLAGHSPRPAVLDPAAATALLDSIKGAWEGARAGLADIAAGRVSPLDEL